MALFWYIPSFEAASRQTNRSLFAQDNNEAQYSSFRLVPLLLANGHIDIHCFASMPRVHANAKPALEPRSIAGREEEELCTSTNKSLTSRKVKSRGKNEDAAMARACMHARAW